MTGDDAVKRPSDDVRLAVETTPGACCWKGAPAQSLTRCPKCSSSILRDDHVATPRAVAEESQRVGAV